MLQRQLLFVITCAVLLASCGGNATPTPASGVQNNATTATTLPPTPSEIVPTNGPREYSTEEIVMPQTGTIVPPATEDPKAGNLFDTVALDRIGGIEGKPLDILLLK